MNLGFVSGRMVSVEDGGVWTDAGEGRLIDALRSRVDELHVAMSLAPTKRPSHAHRLAISAAEITFLPHMPSTIASLPHGGSCRKAIARVERLSDVVIVQLPFAPPWALVPPLRPRVYHACADVPAVVAASQYYRGPRRIAALTLAEFMHSWQRNLIRGPTASLVANGEELRARLGDDKGTAVVSSAMLAAEVDSVARSRPRDSAFRILYVGYLRPEKGLDVLVDAYRALLQTRPDAELHIVGSRGLSEAGAETDLRRALEDVSSRGNVVMHGQAHFGPELFQHYADADVLALPSRSEGTPRVLVEARAFRCPVVASNVGGIPTSVTNGVDGLLVPPNDPTALCEALLGIANDQKLRDRLIEGGLRRARASTAEALADVLSSEAIQLLEKSKSSSPRHKASPL